MNLIDDSPGIAFKGLTYQMVDRLAGIARPKHVSKRWGEETSYFNNEYCLKTITIKDGCESSMHFHVRKHETLLVIKGILTLKYNDGRGLSDEMDLQEGEAIIIPPGFQHRLCAYHGQVVLVEGSTYDDEKDSIRVSL